MKIVSGKKFAKILEKQGWVLKRIKGSHLIYFLPSFRDHVTVPIHGNQDLKKGIQHGLMKDTGITEDML